MWIPSVPLSVIESLGLAKERYVTETEILIKAGDSGREVRSVVRQGPVPAGAPDPLPLHPRRRRHLALCDLLPDGEVGD